MRSFAHAEIPASSAAPDLFVRLMRPCEEVRVMTYCVASNHFHVLVEVTQRAGPMPDEAQLLAKLKRFYSLVAFAQVRWPFEDLRRLGAEPVANLFDSVRHAMTNGLVMSCSTTHARGESQNFREEVQ
ncbi:MAG: hypothetical protein ABI318_08940 [Chthoniobacteraceae bacterium]